MGKSNLWQNAMKIRKSFQLQYDRINLEEETINEKFKRILMSVFREMCNPKNVEINITIKQESGSDTSNIIYARISGNVSGATEWIYFLDCECENLFNEIKEILIKNGIKFSLENWSYEYKFGTLSLKMQPIQQSLNS
ncbi:MAG: hypothetical protein J6C46_01555 [Clostridia bacterium]|nr:hypothetical protein [Clostridia bacterium]